MRSNHDIIQAHYAASDRKDIAGMMADVSPEVRWTEMAGFPCAGTWVGPQQVIENVFKVLGGTWDGYAFKLERLIDGGDSIVGIGDYRGTYRATGKSMHARVVHVWQLEGGKVVRFEQFTDTLLVARAMA
jgi:ketosteroid isomerase-like protein